MTKPYPLFVMENGFVLCCDISNIAHEQFLKSSKKNKNNEEVFEKFKDPMNITYTYDNKTHPNCSMICSICECLSERFEEDFDLLSEAMDKMHDLYSKSVEKKKLL